MTRILAALVAIAAAAGTSLQAQGASFVGTWDLNFPVGMQIENGAPALIMGTGVLTIEAQQDSLIGTLVTNPPPGMPARPPARLAAKAGPGEVVFVSRTMAQMNSNGEEREIAVVSTWRLKVTADSIAGTVERSIEGLDVGPQQPGPVTGARKN